MVRLLAITYSAAKSVRHFLEHFSPCVLPAGTDLNLYQHTIMKDNDVNRTVTTAGGLSAVDDLGLSRGLREKFDNLLNQPILVCSIEDVYNSHARKILDALEPRTSLPY
jgi:hypothetical protein